jgi:methylmalonyl-CoA mutase cobalamin-binding subunit
MADKTEMGPPRAAIVAIGDAAQLRARIDFCRDLLGIAGCSVLTPPPVAVVEQFSIGDEWASAEGNEPDVFVICAADDAYEMVISPVIVKIRENYPCASPLILVAGQLGDREDAMRAVGVFACMHRHINPISFLTSLVDAIAAARRERTNQFVLRPPFPTENSR